MGIDKIDIRPGVSVLSVLRHLNYKHWYALAEFVDNSIESFIKHSDEIKKIHGPDYKLRVDIDIDTSSPPSIFIRDNAAGIFETEYERAFRPASIPLDRTGLAEFGMGMKSAACWFSPRWTVRTSALGEPVSRTIHFDITKIVDDNIEELAIKENKEKLENHYTEVVLQEIFHTPVGRTVGKIKEHLTDIYRAFIRDGNLDLYLNGERLVFIEPSVLKAPYYKDQDGPIREWRKLIKFDFGEGLSVQGFAAIREEISWAKAGFSLFRRGRVIQGSGDDGYRPSYICGASSNFKYGRLFGELHLKGFEVSHTKDGFQWDENEQPFLELLREHLNDGEFPLLRQADKFRVHAARAQLTKFAEQAVKNTTEVMEKRLPEVLPELAAAEPVVTSSEKVPHTSTLARRQFEITFRERNWVLNVELTDDPAESRWLVFSDTSKSREQPRHLDIRVSMAHPFMVRFAQIDAEDVEALLRVATALALAEVLARDSGVRSAGTVIRNVNDLLTSALSKV